MSWTEVLVAVVLVLGILGAVEFIAEDSVPVSDTDCRRDMELVQNEECELRTENQSVFWWFNIVSWTDKWYDDTAQPSGNQPCNCSR